MRMSEQYRKAEKMLYTYPVKIMRLHEALTEYANLKRSTDYSRISYEYRGKNKSPTDPAGNYESRLLELVRKINAYMKATRVITELRNELSCSDKENKRILFLVMELIYLNA